MDKLKGINTYNYICSIIGAVMTGLMLLMIIISPALYYAFGIMMIVTHIIELVLSKKSGNKITGNVLGIIAGSLHAISGLLAIPAMILYILAAIFCYKKNR